MVFLVSLFWIDYENGGRKEKPPDNSTYYSVTKICINNNIVYCSIKLDIGKNDTALLSFLFEGFSEGITQNETLELYEGAKKVCTVKILDVLDHQT